MTQQMDSIDWSALVREIYAGRLVPIIGDSLGRAMISDAQDLRQLYADYVNYPGDHRDGRAEIARFVATEYDDYGAKNDYLTFLKQLALATALENGSIDENVYDGLEKKAEEIPFSSLADAMGHPWLDGGPYPLLARLPLPLYITTSCHDFMQAALASIGKEPQTQVLHWNDDLDRAIDLDPDYKPSVEQPLVYHLFGRDADPLSLVLSEDDHLRFLRYQRTAPLPSIGYLSLNESVLLLMGLRFVDWEFRALTHGLLRHVERRRGPSLAVDLAPVDGEPSPGPVRDYLQAYMAEEQVDVYWEPAQQFFNELFGRMDS